MNASAKLVCEVSVAIFSGMVFEEFISGGAAIETFGFDDELLALLLVLSAHAVR